VQTFAKLGVGEGHKERYPLTGGYTAVALREPFNTWSHLLPAVLLLLGGGLLVMQPEATALERAAFGVYGFCAVLLFSASASYHWADVSYRWLQKLDHSAIYLMIAGTYTPLCLVGLPSPIGLNLLVLQWLLALIGIATTASMEKPPTWLRLVLYLVMGWMVLPLAGMLINQLGGAAFAWVVAGGLAYTVGTVFYGLKKPDLWPEKFGYHGLWHLFVIAGAACHFVFMFYLG
jgi:hemolysin III